MRRCLVTVASPKAVRRFYEATSVQQDGIQWRVLLDDRVLRTPQGSVLEFPSRGVAEGVAQEWGAQGEHLKPKEMPLTTIACTSIDIVRKDSRACVERLLPYLAMDTVCFEDSQELLAERQRAEWGPLRCWFEHRFDVELGVATGLEAPAHSETTTSNVEVDLLSRDEWELCALEIATNTAKSFIVAVALLERQELCAEDALRLALLEEYFQIERWGLVEGEHDVAHSESLVWLR
eukprot:CAMPEP_0171066432 /NCGR_PEP_ID=MMETSP0766_2-20121228/7416_1 /TAXON_ID=439317 /ORGANISM="Gambierdiscus australes, Strain CAWD 149" /LENGTH=234 /DNA_ID=CAMNT_0011522605 /DNA_START=32 /DNA_END=732 /DNA_ORIENTATION=+